MAKPIPVSEPWFDNAEIEALREVILSTYVTEARKTEKFERLICDRTGARHAIAMMNGTVALFCAIKAVGVGPGDEVVVPDLTFVATANAALLAGARPVFADIEPRTLGLDAGSLERAITPRTKAIIVTHLYGLAAEMDPILEFAERRGVAVIEDAAQAHGVRYRGRHAGTLSSAGVLSFYGNKTITTGEGGVVLTDDDEIAQACRRLKNHGRDVKGTFFHPTIGWNFCMSEMQAALGVVQLQKLDAILARKIEIWEMYREGLRGVPGVEILPVPRQVEPAFWLVNIFLDHPEELSTALGQHNVLTRRLFPPLHQQPCYRDVAPAPGPFPEATRAYARGLSLPSSATLGRDEVLAICRLVLRHLEEAA